MNVASARVELQLDRPTASEVELLAAESEPPRRKAEMYRHLLRLGLREYRRQLRGETS